MHALPDQARVVIIGGGFAGAATAYALARAGVDGVLILEREDVCGYHASGRNAALGRQLAEDDEVTALTTRGAAFLRNPPAGFADTPLQAQNGSVLLVDEAADIDALCAHAGRWALPHEPIAPAQLAARWPVLADVPTAGGVLFPTDGVIDVHALLAGYLRGARAGGARIEVGCEVEGFRDRGAVCEVRTRRGTVTTSCVVMAAGAWVEDLGRRAGAHPVRYAPILRHLFVTEAVATLDRQAPFVWHVGRDEFYVRPEGAGYLLSGCDETEVAPCDAVPAPGALEGLAARIGARCPGLMDLGIARAWACLRTFAPDRRPVIGWDAERPWLFWVAGLGGHGATASAAVGERAAAGLRARLG